MGQSDLPLASGRKHVKVFESLGWVVRRDASHIVMTRPGSEATLSIPAHDEIARATLHSIVKSAGYTDKQYRAYFDAL
jgi:predicted RNA binding protein YcfA (HicA-like mRNA interferase family)